MNTEVLRSELFEDLCAIPLLDSHTHLVGGRLGARGLHDVLLYHMGITDLHRPLRRGLSDRCAVG